MKVTKKISCQLLRIMKGGGFEPAKKVIEAGHQSGVTGMKSQGYGYIQTGGVTRGL